MVVSGGRRLVFKGVYMVLEPPGSIPTLKLTFRPGAARGGTGPGTSWDGMAWDGMAWNGMASDGMAWDGMT